MSLFDNFYYDELSPSCLRYAKDTLKFKKGDVAGVVSGSEEKGFYWNIKSGNRRRKVHRIILELHEKDIEGFVTDHLNGNSLDNRLENLRICTTKENSKNKKMYKSNSSGACGVNFMINRAGNTYAHARYYQVNGKRVSKYFSVNKLGIMVAFRDAVIWRDSKIKEVNIEGAGYTDRHGK